MHPSSDQVGGWSGGREEEFRGYVKGDGGLLILGGREIIAFIAGKSRGP